MRKISLVFIVILGFAAPLVGQEVDTAWVRVYNGAGNGEDCARAIALDKSGNVYVTGWSYDSATNFDYATIKYDSQGNELWVGKYNGPGNGGDKAYAMAIDNSSNVYVTGWSFGNGTYSDFATVKYDSLGSQLWVRRYDGPAGLTDGARAITLDNSGNVYVTGYSYAIESDYDIITIKYDSLGNERWVAKYDGPAHYTDWASDIDVDNSGNVYVTGADSWSAGLWDYEYVTLKYDSLGNQLWVDRYLGPEDMLDSATAIVIDNSGNIYVTGFSVGVNGGYLTIKYDSTGSRKWLKRYYGPERAGAAYAMAKDNSGHVYVTGWSENIVTAQTYVDYATVKYDSLGNEIWVRRYDGPIHFYDRAYVIAVDSSGGVYVTGYSFDTTAQDYATVKYDSQGNEIWVKRYSRSAVAGGVGEETGNAITVDNSGNVYVTGQSYTNATGYDYSTIKYIQFWRGDANGDRKVTVSDVVYLVNYLFKGGPLPAVMKTGDTNCDGNVTVADVVYLINFLFKGGPKPAC